jgi:enoyl-CoA hydratase/carnithine racemase
VELPVPDVTVRVTDGTAEVAIANRARRNAMTLAMWRRLREVAEACAGDGAVEVVVVRGAGEEAFCAGADISEFQEFRHDPDAIRTYDAAVAAAEAALWSLGKPSVAALRGACMGGGVTIAAACDVRLAADDVRLAIPAARLGVTYPRSTVRRLVDLVGGGAAFDLLATARVVEAEEALRLGLVNQVGPPETLDERVAAYVRLLRRAAPLSVRAARLAVRAALRPDDAEAQAELDGVEAAAAASEDYREGIAAFLDKRPPRFRA